MLRRVSRAFLGDLGSRESRDEGGESLVGTAAKRATESVRRALTRGAYFSFAINSRACARIARRCIVVGFSRILSILAALLATLRRCTLRRYKRKRFFFPWRSASASASDYFPRARFSVSRLSLRR